MNERNVQLYSKTKKDKKIKEHSCGIYYSVDAINLTFSRQQNHINVFCIYVKCNPVFFQKYFIKLECFPVNWNASLR